MSALLLQEEFDLVPLAHAQEVTAALWRGIALGGLGMLVACLLVAYVASRKRRE